MYSGTHKIILLLIMTMLILGGCSSGGGGDSSTTATTTSLSGVAQKGAFFKDSTVSLCKLDDKLVCTDKKLEIKVSDDKGSYEFKTLPWSGLSRLTITGYYLDELTGEKSLSPATITAIIDIKSKVKQKSNTNLLTDLRAKRMKKLVDAGKSKEDADKESKEDVKQLFHVSSDDFSALNLTDFTQGKASVNVELLRLSAAVANAQDPVATLEELMKIYNEYGIEGVLNSTLYKTLMGLIKDVDVKAVVTKIAGTDEANVLTVQDLSPFAIANIVTYGSVDTDSKVRITLIGTEFTDTPSISVSSTNSLLGIDAMHLADDNKSVVLDMNLSTSCQDINATFTVDYLGLKDVATPIRTTVLRYKNANEYCVTANNDGDNLGTITMPPKANISLVPMEDNKIRLSLAGTEFENYTGTIEAELITSSDTLTIDKAVVADDNKSVVFTLNGNTDYCTDNNVTIKLDASYLKNRDANLTSNKIRYVSPNVVASCGGNTNPIPISFNRAPTVSITPSALSEVPAGSTVELNATAEDINTEDSVTLLWKYKKVGSDPYITAGTTDKFSQTFTSAGNYIVEVTATDNHDASTTASVQFEVVAVNHAPTVSISPSTDKNITIGDSVVLRANAADEDGDDLTISWKIKEFSASEFTTVNNFRGTGFNHTFDTIGTYLVVVEAEDSSGAKADANITVKVSSLENSNEKAILTSQNYLEENSLDGAVFEISLTNGLKFSDNILEVSNFTLQKAPEGVSIQTVEYINPITAKITLAFDGTDINTTKEIVVSISKDELSSSMDVAMNPLTVYEDIVSGYDDINETIQLHTSDHIPLGIEASENLTLSTLPREGNASAYTVGNEFWYVDYNHTSCKLSDRIVYDSTNGKGKININVAMPLPDLSDRNISIWPGSILYNYFLVEDSSIKSVYIYPPEHGTAEIVKKDNAYYLTYTPDAHFSGTEKLALTLNSEIDGCAVSSNMVITVNVILTKNYEMFSALDANGTCHPYVTDGNITQKINDISFDTDACYTGFNYGGYNEFKKVGNKFVFVSYVGHSHIYRVNPATLGFSSWSDYSVEMDRSLIVSKSFPPLIYRPDWTYDHTLVFTSYKNFGPPIEQGPNNENSYGTMPWGLKTTGDPYLIEDVVGESEGDVIVSNYMQDYRYYSSMRLPGDHIYSVGYDEDNGNGMSLNKSCVFEGLETCSSGEKVWYPGTGSSDVWNVALAVDKNNFAYVFDEHNHKLWITVDLNLNVLDLKDETRLMDDVNFTSMKFQRASNGVVYYDGYNAGTQHREIGYFYEKKTSTLLTVHEYPADWSEAHIESSTVEDFFSHATLLKKIANLDATGDFFVASNKVYISKVTDPSRHLEYWYELDMNGTLTMLPSQTRYDSKAAFYQGDIETMKYINGYIYMIGHDRYDSTKAKMVVVDTENNNTVTLLESDKYVTLFPNELYKNDYNFRKIIYRTQEKKDDGTYVYNVYGYNPYKNEKTLLKTYTKQP